MATYSCPKCGKEIKNPGALRTHEAHCQAQGKLGPEGNVPEITHLSAEEICQQWPHLCARVDALERSQESSPPFPGKGKGAPVEVDPVDHILACPDCARRLEARGKRLTDLEPESEPAREHGFLEEIFG